MKAVRLRRSGAQPEVEDAPGPAVAHPLNVLVEVDATDLIVDRWIGLTDAPSPHALGHGTAGRVLDIGPGGGQPDPVTCCTRGRSAALAVLSGDAVGLLGIQGVLARAPAEVEVSDVSDWGSGGPGPENDHAGGQRVEEMLDRTSGRGANVVIAGW